ncbi:MAG: TIGR00282 family metallophosphoesterase [Candidatus Limnocylindrales bacterium]
MLVSSIGPRPRVDLNPGVHDVTTTTGVLAADKLPSPPEKPARGHIRVLMIGDVIGKPGREALEQVLPRLRDERHIDLVTANGENLAGGMGLTPSTAASLFNTGVDVITSGNHIWDKRDIYPELDRDERILRPINYGEHGVPGRGWGVYHATDGSEVAVINAQGRTYMAQIENPFTMLDGLLNEGADELPKVRLVDFHCELTSEKNAFGLYLDGRVSAVCGTHTHVATADERILPRGTGYISDIGMTGPLYSVIGFDPSTVLPRFINALPTRFEVGSGPVLFNAVQIDVDTSTGRATAIQRLNQVIDV